MLLCVCSGNIGILLDQLSQFYCFVWLLAGISPASSKQRTKDAHKRVMLLNHPDKGGSPYLAAKINEAKDMLDKER